jgi:hypothetical protein
MISTNILPLLIDEKGNEIQTGDYSDSVKARCVGISQDDQYMILLLNIFNEALFV